MTVSVIIPTYNRKEQVTKAIESVLAQSYKDLEVIVVDDGSDDNTYDYLNTISDNRLKVYRLASNQGACAARNYGIHRAKGEMIAFQDSDDIWRADYLSEMVSVFQNVEADVVFCKLLRHNLNGHEQVFPQYELGYKDQIELIRRPRISTQTIMGRKDCFIKVQFDERLPRLQDYDLIIRLSGRYRLYHYDRVLVDVYIQEDSLSVDHQKLCQALAIITDKYPDLWKKHPEVKAMLYDIHAGTLKRIGVNPIVYYQKALSVRPTFYRALKCLVMWLKYRIFTSSQN